jgi:hypothetical protein
MADAFPAQPDGDAEILAALAPDGPAQGAHWRMAVGHLAGGAAAELKGAPDIQGAGRSAAQSCAAWGRKAAAESREAQAVSPEQPPWAAKFAQADAE